MNYNDKHTRLLKDKHQNKPDYIGSDRSNRREFEREFKKFKEKFCSYTSSEIWECIEKSDQEGLFNSWRFALSFNGKTALSFNDKTAFKFWLKNKIKSINIDKQLYRDKIIDRLLDEV